MSYSPKEEIQLKVDLICDLMKNNSSLTGDKNESLKHMVNEIPVNSYSTDNIPVFIYSIYYNYCNIFEILLSGGVDINLPYNKLNKSTPLMVAIEQNNEYMIERLLSYENIDLFYVTQYKENIFFFMGIYMTNLILFKRIVDMMIQKNKEKTLYFLRMQRYSSQKKNIDTKTPVHCCIYYLNMCRKNTDDYKNDKYHQDLTFDKIKIIMNSLNDYDKYMVNDFKNLFEELITSNEFRYVCHNFQYFVLTLYEYLRELGITRRFKYAVNNCVMQQNMFLLAELIKDNYDIDDRYFEYGTPLFTAMLMDNYFFTSYLLDLGCKKYCNIQGINELLIAISNDNLDMVKLLEEHNYSLTYEHEDSNEKLMLPKYFRPLHLAVYYNAINCAKYIIQKTGDDICFPGNCLESPIGTGLKNEKINLNYLDVLKGMTNKKPYQKFNSKYGEKHLECCICLDKIEKKDIFVSKCGHVFHEDCILTNMKNTNSCPYCRTEIELFELYDVKICDYKFKSKKNLKRKRTKSYSFIDTNPIDTFGKLDKLDLDNYEVLDTNIHEIKFNQLKEKLEEKDRIRKIKELRKYLHSLKCFKNIRKPKTKTFNSPILREYKPSLQREMKKLECFYNTNTELKRSDRSARHNNLTY